MKKKAANHSSPIVMRTNNVKLFWHELKRFFSA